MTATEVNGLKVVKVEPALSPLSGHNGSGKPVYLSQTKLLTLEDGSQIFGCAHCPYTHHSTNGVRPHLKVHAEPRPQVVLNGSDPVADLTDGLLTLTEFVERVRILALDAGQADEWRERALAAERELSQLRRKLASALSL